MMMQSLWSRPGKAVESSREARLRRAGAAAEKRSGQSCKDPLEAAEVLQAMLASRNLLIAIKDLEGRYLDVNDAYARALGLEVQVVRGRLDRDLLAPAVAGSMAQRERLAMRGVALKPELESFADDSPAYLVERLPILNGAGELRAVCLIALESRTPVPVAEVEWMRIDPQLEGAAPGVETAQIDPVIGPCAGRAPLAAPVWLVAGAALKQLEWDAALYHSLLSHFCQRYEGFGVRLAERVAAGRAGELAQELGRLASGARNLGAIPVADLAGEWVEALKCGAVDDSGARLAPLRAALDATILVIECRIRSCSATIDWPAAASAPMPPMPPIAPVPALELAVA